MNRDPKRVGWRERVALPDFGINVLRAKMDTGARTSAIGVMDLVIKPDDDARGWAFFKLRPRVRSHAVQCSAPLVDERHVRDARGTELSRLFIKTRLVLGAEIWTIELGLAARETMRFPMLIGRRGMQNLCIDPAAGYLCGRPDRNVMQSLDSNGGKSFSIDK